MSVVRCIRCDKWIDLDKEEAYSGQEINTIPPFDWVCQYCVTDKEVEMADA